MAFAYFVFLCHLIEEGVCIIDFYGDCSVNNLVDFIRGGLVDGSKFLVEDTPEFDVVTLINVDEVECSPGHGHPHLLILYPAEVHICARGKNALCRNQRNHFLGK